MVKLEHTEELDTLTCIYGDELKILNDDPVEFEIYIISDDKNVELKLTVTLPEHYPETMIPFFKFNTDQYPDIHSKVSQELTNELGMPSCFTLISMTKELLDKAIHQKIELEKEVESELRKRRDLAQRKEALRNAGTAFTLERYWEWKKARDSESTTVEKSQKITGKQMFQSNKNLN